MTKRKRDRPRITAAMLPLIRDHVAARTDAFADELSGKHASTGDGLSHLSPRLRRAMLDYARQLPDGISDYARTAIRAEAAALRSDAAVMWFVTEPMTIVARQAAPDLPDWTPSVARPARSGIVMWGGATGLACPMELLADDNAMMASLLGMAWDFDDAGEFSVTPLVFAPRDRDAGPGGVVVAEVGRAAWHPSGNVTGFTAPLWKMLGATWLLAQSPTVGRTYGVRYDRRDPDRPFARPDLPSSITVVALREIARRDELGDAFDDGLSRQDRHGPSYRHMVRGHWRQQPCGPGRRLRKPVFVAPFARGPGDLVTKPTVHVWKR